MIPFLIYSTGHCHSVAVCDAMRAGTGFPIVPPAPLQPGGVAMYGFLRGLLPTLHQATREGRPWVYADRGYFGATIGTDYTGTFRLTRDALQHDGRGETNGERLRKRGIRIKPWRRSGTHVLVCPPGDVFASSIGGFDAGHWLRDVLAGLRQSTDRAIVVREKSRRGSTPLSAQLADCFALVTYTSNAATEALLAGVPVFCTGSCAASSMGRSDIGMIEEPVYPDDRERWAGVLADNQWTLDEIRKGMARHVFS